MRRLWGRGHGQSRYRFHMRWARSLHVDSTHPCKCGKLSRHSHFGTSRQRTERRLADPAHWSRCLAHTALVLLSPWHKTSLVYTPCNCQHE
jgi:hypothetical protein